MLKSCETYLLPASKRKGIIIKIHLILSSQEFLARYFVETHSNICGLITNSKAIFAFVVICSLLLRLSWNCKGKCKVFHCLFSFQLYQTIYFCFQSTSIFLSLWFSLRVPICLVINKPRSLLVSHTEWISYQHGLRSIADCKLHKIADFFSETSSKVCPW